MYTHTHMIYGRPKKSMLIAIFVFLSLETIDNMLMGLFCKII